MTFLPQPLPTTVANVAALATNASKTSNGGIISTSGYYAAGDGGAVGVIYRRSGRSALGGDANDGVWYFNGPGIDDYWEKVDKGRVNLLQAGCVGDGVTDDTDAFVAAAEVALRESVPLEVPKGEFLLSSLSSHIVLDDDFTITGVGYQSQLIGPNISQTLFYVSSSAACRVICEQINFSTFRNAFMFEDMRNVANLHDVTIANNICDNMGQGICNPVDGALIRASSIQVIGNRLTNMGLNLTAARPWAIDIGIKECPKTLVGNNLIDGVGSLNIMTACVGIWVDCTGSDDDAQSVVISNNIIKNVLSSSRASTDQIGGIFALECHPTITGNVIDTIAGMPAQSISANAGTDVITSNTHRLLLNDALTFIGDDLPAPLAESTTYYARNITANTFKISENSARLFTANSGTDFITATAHGMLDGDTVMFSGTVYPGTTLPSPLDGETLYYVRDKTTDTFKVALTAGGVAINITDAGTGFPVWFKPDDTVDITDAGSGTMQFLAPHPSSPEAIYTKSSHSVVSNNTIIDTLGSEGVINMKGEFTGSASAQRSVISGNNISFRTLPQTTYCTGINCAAPDISIIGNIIEGVTRGAVAIFDGCIFSNNVFRDLQATGIEFVSIAADYNLIVKDNIFTNIGTGASSYGVLVTASGGAGLDLLEVRNNTFMDFTATTTHIGVLVINAGTAPIRKFICNCNLFNGVDKACIVQVSAAEEVHYIEFSFNTMFDTSLEFESLATSRVVKRLQNTRNGKLWIQNDSPAAFDPTLIAGCVSWWQPSDRRSVLTDVGSGALASDGNLIARINDKSGAGNHLNANGVAPILHSAETSGLANQSVYFRGLGDDMQCTLPASCGNSCTMFMVQKIGGIQRFTANPATDFITAEIHGKLNDDIVRFIGNDLPAGLSAGVDYYVINRTGDTFQVSNTLGGLAVNITDEGSGLMRFTHIDPGFLWWYQHDYWGAADQRWLWIAVSGSATADGAGYLAGTPTYRKNGASVTFTTRDNVFDETSDVLCLITAEGLDLSAWDGDADQFHLGGFLAGSYYVTGHFLECILYDQAVSSRDRAAIEEYLAESHEITLA